MREGWQVISEESDRLNALINNLLDASRIQAGGFNLERAEVDWPRLLAASRWRTSARGDRQRHRFVLDFPQTSPVVAGDEERLRQVFQQPAQQRGQVFAGRRRNPRRGMAQGGEVTLYVADQGIGIPESEQGNLFQRFYRLDSSLRRSTQGAGLGLYLCRTIVEAHGGRIWLRSEPGKGTTVFFTLPLCQDGRTQ
jgi:signal transduction histidine kinase